MSKNKSTRPVLIEEANLSSAWGNAFLHVIDNPGKEISPLVISITGFDEDGTPPEDVGVRQALDATLKEIGQLSIEDVAYTIFPQRLWTMAKGDRRKLFDLYRMAFPRYKVMKQQNHRGLYFERLTNYSPDGKCDGNQLEWIITHYQENPAVRRSMFQASTFDPVRDHVNQARLVFPCLQQISFIPADDGLVVNAFYATQLLLQKAYGNYLGLARLGAFIAHEMNMPLARLNVTVGIEKLEEVGKTNPVLRNVIQASRELQSSTQ